jgi:hypothetical protein
MIRLAHFGFVLTGAVCLAVVIIFLWSLVATEIAIPDTTTLVPVVLPPIEKKEQIPEPKPASDLPSLPSV